ncbi:hypothetical protein HPB47_028126, partial [Ixodes persulcatus]
PSGRRRSGPRFGDLEAATTERCARKYVKNKHDQYLLKKTYMGCVVGQLSTEQFKNRCRLKEVETMVLSCLAQALVDTKKQFEDKTVPFQALVDYQVRHIPLRCAQLISRLLHLHFLVRFFS